MDQFFSIRQSEGGAEFGNVSKMEEGSFAEVFDVGVIVEVGVHFDTQVCEGLHLKDWHVLAVCVLMHFKF